MLINIPDEQQARIEALAKERGYSSAADYLLALVAVDAEENILQDDFLEDPEEASIDLEAQFREAWHDAMTGNTRPAEEVLAEIRARREQENHDHAG